MKEIVLIGNIDFVKLLASKYGAKTPIGKIINMEEKTNEPKSETAVYNDCKK